MAILTTSHLYYTFRKFGQRCERTTFLFSTRRLRAGRQGQPERALQGGADQGSVSSHPSTERRRLEILYPEADRIV